MFVLGIILLLHTTTGGCKKQDNIDQQLTKPKMAVVEAAIIQFFYDCGRYPASLEELIEPPAELEDKWDGPYLLQRQLLDPWGNKYIYVPEGKVNVGSFDLISYGADGKPGGEGDNKDIYND